MKKTLLFIILLCSLYNLSACGSEKETVDSMYFVSLSINPKIDFIINEQQEIIEMFLINDDAKILLADINVLGYSIDQALEIILDAAVDTGYINIDTDENIINYLAFDEKGSMDYQLQIKEKIMNYLNKEKIGAALFSLDETSNDVKEFAITNDLSIPYTKLILDYQELHPDITIQEILEKNHIELLNTLKNDFNANYQNYLNDEKSDALELRNEMVLELENKVGSFRTQANDTNFPTPDFDVIKTNSMLNYQTMIENIEKRSLSRKSYYEAKRDGVIAQFLVGGYTFDGSSVPLPYIVNYHNLTLTSEGTFREWLSWSSREVSQTTTQDTTYPWTYVDGEIVVQKSTMQTRFQVEDGRIVFEYYGGTKIYFIKTN